MVTYPRLASFQASRISSTFSVVRNPTMKMMEFLSPLSIPQGSIYFSFFEH